MEGQTRHIGFLDHIRGVAILAVFAFHAFGATYGFFHLPWAGWHRALPPEKSAWLFALFSFGWMGVPVFFVVSGFCIHLSFARRPSWSEYFTRRFFRIYPPYFIALLVFALVFPGNRLKFHAPDDLVELGSHLLLVHNLGDNTFFGINGAFWSIAVEAQLYLLYPLLLLCVRRFGWKRALMLTAVIELALRAASYPFIAHASGDINSDVPKWIAGSPFFYWFSWSVGAYLAGEFLQGKSLPFSKWPTAALVGAIVVAEFIRPLSVFTFTLTALLTVSVMAKILSGKTWPVKLPTTLSTHLVRIGLWSYSIYLLHQPILGHVGEALRRHLPGIPGRSFVIMAIVLGTWFVIMPISGWWHRVLELKGIALGKRVSAGAVHS